MVLGVVRQMEFEVSREPPRHGEQRQPPARTSTESDEAVHIEEEVLPPVDGRVDSDEEPEPGMGLDERTPVAAPEDVLGRNGAPLGSELNVIGERLTPDYNVGVLPSVPPYVSEAQLVALQSVQWMLIVAAIGQAKSAGDLLAAADAAIRFLLAAHIDVVRCIPMQHLEQVLEEARRAIPQPGARALALAVTKAESTLRGVAAAVASSAHHVTLRRPCCCGGNDLFGSPLYEMLGLDEGAHFVWLGDDMDNASVPPALAEASIRGAEEWAMPTRSPAARPAFPPPDCPLVLRGVSGTYAYRPRGCVVECCAAAPHTSWVWPCSCVLLVGVLLVLLASVALDDDAEEPLVIAGTVFLVVCGVYVLLDLVPPCLLVTPCCAQGEAMRIAAAAQHRVRAPASFLPDGPHADAWHVFSPQAHVALQLLSACDRQAKSSTPHTTATCTRPMPVPPLLAVGLTRQDVADLEPRPLATVQRLAQAAQPSTASAPDASAVAPPPAPGTAADGGEAAAPAALPPPSTPTSPPKRQLSLAQSPVKRAALAEDSDVRAELAAQLQACEDFMTVAPPSVGVMLADVRLDAVPGPLLTSDMVEEPFQWAAGGIAAAEAGLTTQEALSTQLLLAQLPGVERPDWAGWFQSPAAWAEYTGSVEANEWVRTALRHQLTASSRAPLDTLRAEAVALRECGAGQQAWGGGGEDALLQAAGVPEDRQAFPGVTVYTSWARPVALILDALRK